MILNPALALVVIARLERDYAQKLTLSGFAAEYGLSRQTIDQAVRAQLGMGVTTYLRQVRFRQAVALLHAGEKIDDIARAVGYRSKKDFYRLIRQQTGGTPRQLRGGDPQRWWLPSTGVSARRQDDSARDAR